MQIVQYGWDCLYKATYYMLCLYTSLLHSTKMMRGTILYYEIVLFTKEKNSLFSRNFQLCMNFQKLRLKKN